MPPRLQFFTRADLGPGLTKFKCRNVSPVRALNPGLRRCRSFAQSSGLPERESEEESAKQSSSCECPEPKPHTAAKWTRRHSVVLSGSNGPCVPEPQFSFNSSFNSVSTISSFAGREYMSMMEEWCSEEVEEEMMTSSGSEFKNFALKPHVKSCGSDFFEKESKDTSASRRTFSEFFDLNVDEPVVQSMEEENHEADGELCDAKISSLSLGSFFSRATSSPRSPRRRVSRKESLKSLSRCSSSSMDGNNWPTYSGTSEEFSKFVSELKTFEFSALDHSADDLALFVSEIFFQLGLDRHLNIPPASIHLFVMSVRSRMLDNAYHNWTHVVDVVQTLFSLVVQTGLVDRLNHIQRLALVLAGLCHDLEHPGVSAAYLLKSNSTLAARYKKDPGLLEKHHSVRAFELIACGDSCILDGLPRASKLEVTRLVRQLIMATDMTRHGDFVAAMRSILDERACGGASPPPASDECCSEEAVADSAACSDVAEDSESAALGSPTLGSPSLGSLAAWGGVPWLDPRLLEMQLLLKCADVSNVVKPFRVAREWAVRVTEEFFAQGDLERSNGLEVTPMCDRTSQSRVALQKAFIDFLAGPFHTGVAQVFPSLVPMLDEMAENRRRWESCADQALVFYMASRRERVPWMSSGR